MTTPAAAPARRSRAILAITAGIVLALVIAFFIFSGLYADSLWYTQLGFSRVLYTEWVTQTVLFVIGFLALALPVWASIQIAYRTRPVYAKLTAQLDRYQQVVEPLRRVAVIGIPIVIGLFSGVSASTRWQPVLLFLHGGTSTTVDPQFHLPVTFYMFQLPVLHGIVGFASAALVLAELAALGTTYLYGSLRVTGREVRVARPARIQLAVIFALFLLVQAVSLYLDQFITLYQENSGGIFTGAGYADVNAVIPSRLILAVIAALVAALFIVTAVIGRWRLPIIGTALLVVSSIIIGGIYPWVVQTFTVHPSQQTLEAAYVKRNIDATRTAYGISDVKASTYDATSTAQAGQLKSDAETTTQIRILDPNVVSDTFGQDQQVKQYYQFPSTLDVDRYVIKGKSQDVVVGVRELNQSGLGAQQTAYANAFVYTHGYGLVAAAGNERSSDGSPVYLESNIPQTGELGSFKPQVYFGPSEPAYSVVGAPKGTKSVELDGTGSAATTFEGSGGPSVGNLFNRLIYAMKFQSDQILLSSSVNSKSQILYNRDPKSRVEAAAPYLTVDSDAYPSVVNGHLVWVVDGYTTSSSYPYSEQQSLSDATSDATNTDPTYATDKINYIRNSVKATVDAYTGKVTLYAWDKADPVLKAWQNVFPTTVKPMSDMSADLISHVRYPQDLFKVQRTMLGTYHITNPITFQQSNDAWKTPTNPSTPSSADSQPPYYLTMQVPGQTSPTYSLFTSYIPAQNTAGSRSVLTGYLAVDSDAGSTAGKKSADYGKLRLLQLPKTGSTVPGPGQVQSNFTTNTTIASEIKLLDGGGAKVTYGNLLTLPVGGGLLYVEPVYISAQSSDTSYPLLRKVLVAFGGNVAFEDTLTEALDSVFGGDAGANGGDTSASSGSTSGTGTSTSTGTGSSTSTGSGTTKADNAALTKALAAAQAALTAREKDYAANDLVGAATEDEKLQKAIAAAIAAGD